MPAHPLTNFEIQKYYQDEPTFTCVYSSYNLSKIKDGIYVINLDEYKSIGTHWIALNVNGDNQGSSNDATYFDNFEFKHIPKEIKKFISKRNIKTTNFRIQAYDSIMRGYFCIGSIYFMLKGKRNENEMNDKTILKYFCKRF